MLNNRFSKLSLLYVEDEPLISLDAMNALEKCGFGRLHCAYTLKSATEIAHSLHFDCAIMDIHLDRGLSSIDLAQSLVDKGTLIILASGNGMDKAKLEQLGFEHFFIKPYDIKNIIAHIERQF